jgi:hypothetical protein
MTTPLIKQLDDELGLLLCISNNPDTRRRATLILHTLRIEYLYMTSLVGRLPPLDHCLKQIDLTLTLLFSYNDPDIPLHHTT